MDLKERYEKAAKYRSKDPAYAMAAAAPYIDTLEAQLAAANDKLEKYSGMCLSCPDMGMTLVVERLEQEIAAANEAARLQRALDRIEAAGFDEWVLGRYRSCQNTVEYECSLGDEDGTFRRGQTSIEAAEQAAAWAEGQKEGEARERD